MSVYSVASLSVGINHYPTDFYRTNELPLDCAEQDAIRMHAWFDGMSSDDAKRSILIQGAEATFDRVSRAFASLADGRHYDLCVVFMSGHGRVDAGDAYFCLYDAAGDKYRIGAADIESFIGVFDADYTLLVLDCCHAAGVTDGLGTFITLGSRGGRHFIASSRKGQNSYEHPFSEGGSAEQRGSSLLVTAIFEFLHSLPTDVTTIDLSSLVNYVQKRVPELAYNIKGGAVQEPVAGGASSAPLLLPASKFIRAPERVLVTLRRRWRRLILTALSIAGVCLLSIYVVTWHIAFSSNGNLALFFGPSWLPDIPGDMLIRVELPLTVEDITDKPQNRSAALSRDVSGVWPQHVTAGYRRWAETFRPALGADAGPLFDALNGSLNSDEALRLAAPYQLQTMDITAGNLGELSSVYLGPVYNNVSDIVAVSAAIALNRIIVPFDKFFVDGSDEAIRQGYDTRSCQANTHIGYVGWHEGAMWQAVSLWLASSDDPQALRYLTVEARFLDLVLRSEPPRMPGISLTTRPPRFDEIFISTDRDYISSSIERFRHMVRAYASGQFIRGGKIFQLDAMPQLQKLAGDGCAVIADLIEAWAGMGTDMLALRRRIVDDFKSVPARYRQRSGIMADALAKSLVDLSQGGSPRQMLDSWRLFDDLPTDISVDQKIDLTYRLTDKIGMPGEVADALLDAAVEVGATGSETHVPPGWQALPAKMFSDAPVIVELLAKSVTKLDAERAKHFRTVVPIILKEKPFLANRVKLLCALQFLGVQDGGLAAGIHEVMARQRQTLTGADPDLEAIAKNVMLGVSVPGVTEAAFTWGFVPGLYMSNWKGSLPLPSDPLRVEPLEMLAARAQIRFRSPALNPIRLVNELEKTSGDMRERRTVLVMAQEFLRRRPLQDKLLWLSRLRSLRDQQTEAEIRVDLGSLIVALIDSIGDEDLVALSQSRMP